MIHCSPPLMIHCSPPLLIHCSPPLLIHCSPPLLIHCSPPLLIHCSPPLLIHCSPPLAAIFLFGIEELGIQIEEPFGILPLEALCDGSIEGVVMDMRARLVHQRSFRVH